MMRNLLPWLFCLQCTLSYAQPILITEIMADPSPPVSLPEEEYAELLNRSQDTVFFAGWVFADLAKDVPLPAVALPPGEYLILCKSSSDTLFQSFGRVAGLASWPSLNNTGDELFLRDSSGNVVISVSYDEEWHSDNLKSTGGWSLEMMDPSNPCGAGNWTSSVDPAGGTPGRVNSVNGVNPDVSRPIITQATVDDSSLTLLFSEPMNQSTIPFIAIEPELIYHSSGFISSTAYAIRFSASLISDVVYRISISGFRDCAGNIMNPTEMRFGLPSPVQPGDIAVNEILFNPLTGGSDFIELYNRSAAILDIGSLRVANLKQGLPNDIEPAAGGQLLFFPGEYAVLTENRASVLTQYPSSAATRIYETAKLPSFPDDEGDAVVINQAGQYVDRIHYADSLHFPLLAETEGVSLERINYSLPPVTSNWHSASARSGFATPGRVNSQFMVQPGTASWLEVYPKVFTPDNDGKDDVTFITCKPPGTGYNATITVFDESGLPAEVLAANELLGREGTWVWDGRNSVGTLARRGVYIIHLSWFNMKGERGLEKITCVLY